MNHLVWRPVRLPGICDLLEVENVEDDFELTFGTSRKDGWPEDALFRMNPRRKKDVGLADFLNGATLHVISAAAKKTLEAEGVKNVEYLPVTIKNHKGRVASKDYFIMNPQDVCDCVDLAGSKVQWNAIDTDQIATCEGLVLREDVIPSEYKLFRLDRWRYVTVVRRDLADRLKAAGLTGLHFVECQQFRG